MTPVNILGLSHPMIQVSEQHRHALSVTYMIRVHVRLINSMFSSVFSLWWLFCRHCWNFPYEKHIHYLLSQMPEDSADLRSTSKSIRGTTRGTRECPHGNKPLIDVTATASKAVDAQSKVSGLPLTAARETVLLVERVSQQVPLTPTLELLFLCREGLWEVIKGRGIWPQHPLCSLHLQVHVSPSFRLAFEKGHDSLLRSCHMGPLCAAERTSFCSLRVVHRCLHCVVSLGRSFRGALACTVVDGVGRRFRGALACTVRDGLGRSFRGALACTVVDGVGRRFWGALACTVRDGLGCSFRGALACTVRDGLGPRFWGALACTVRDGLGPRFWGALACTVVDGVGRSFRGALACTVRDGLGPRFWGALACTVAEHLVQSLFSAGLELL
ncbi:hypothetical protein J0S82_014045 [Galemys pyrenaicus]|uniref:Uncharacterized protein n=1 Tax=Galemys pyrenaicus TaxID=202257 RepID=A0A8J6DV22_GALPY|nr:hypothetical protein J0S82_014045 [Galemys pyrenaicus]